MTDARKPITLTAKRLFCLQAFSDDRPRSTLDVAKKAISEGINKTRCRYEWADAPMRDLRNAGLLAYAEGRDSWGRRYHRLTKEGEAALAATRS